MKNTTHKGRGRPTKYRQITVSKICDAIADGLPNKYAAALVGISVDTFCEWQNRFPEFSEAVQKATASGILARLRIIKVAGEKGDVRAAQWWLEHVIPEFFARNRIELSQNITGRLQHEIVVSPESLEAIADSRKRYELARTNL